MKLVLYMDTKRAIPCIDWPTAIVGLKTIPGAQNVCRFDAKDGQVSNVWKSTANGDLLPFRQPQHDVYNRLAILAQLEAGEDV